MENTPAWEPIVERATVKLRNVLGELHSIWEDIGFTEEVRTMYCEQAYKHIEDLLNDMVTESEQRKQTLLNNAKELMEQITVLCKELGTDVVTTGYEDLPLKELEQVLRTDMHKLQYCKEQRIAHLEELRAKEKSICKALGSQPIGLDSALPTEEELNSFRLYLEKQEGEKNRLESIFKDMRRSIVKMMDDLGVTPFLDFEHLVYKDPDNFVYSSGNMTKLRELRDHLKSQVDEAKEQVDGMKRELISLWKYLDEPEHMCESFLKSYVGYSSATINALSTEVKRCKDKWRQNLARYVAQKRNELMKLWELCKCAESEIKQFSPFNSNTYTEDLLTLHELEVERMQKFYESNRAIFDLLQEYENLWAKMKELLQRANDPDRFYNRGGQLLAEEKERNALLKKQPKLEAQLKSLIEAYESTHGEAFTVDGMSVDEYLKKSRQSWDEEKETIKKARKEAKDKSIKKVTLSASKKTPSIISSKRHTPLSTSKRKLMFTPSPNSSAKRRNLSILTNGSKVRRSGRVSKRLMQSGGKTPRSNHKKENSVSHSSAATDTTYNQFKEHLEDRMELRSSMLPEIVLTNANKSKMKTPVKTPAKPMRKNLPTPTTPKLSQSQSTRRTPRSPRITQTPRLATVSTPIPIIF